METRAIHKTKGGHLSITSMDAVFDALLDFHEADPKAFWESMRRNDILVNPNKDSGASAKLAKTFHLGIKQKDSA
jgi:hypothetical protein